MKEEYVRDFNKRIIGILKTESSGDIIALAFPSRQILGYYRKNMDKTTDFIGRILYDGNRVTMLIEQNNR